jgi:hypothetical protein
MSEEAQEKDTIGIILLKIWFCGLLLMVYILYAKGVGY